MKRRHSLDFLAALATAALLSLSGCGGGSSSSSTEAEEPDIEVPAIVDHFPKSGPAGSHVYLLFEEPVAEFGEHLEFYYDGERMAISGVGDEVVQMVVPVNATAGSVGIIEVKADESDTESVYFSVVGEKFTELHSETLLPSEDKQVINYNDEVWITVPPGIVESERDLSISVIENAPTSDLNPFETRALDISIDGLAQLDDTIEIALKYDPEALDPEQGATDQLFAMRFDSEAGLWVELPLRVDEDTLTAYIYTDHLSRIALVTIGVGIATIKSPLAVITGAGLVGGVAAVGWVAERITHTTYTTPQGNFRLVYNKDIMDSWAGEWEKPELAAGLTSYSDDHTRSIQDIGELFEVAYAGYIEQGFRDPVPGRMLGDWWRTPVTIKLSGVWGVATGVVRGEDPQYGKIFKAIHLPAPKFKRWSGDEGLVDIGHELFHRFQAEYYNPHRFLSWMNTGDFWWIEATAEYAGHKVAWHDSGKTIEPHRWAHGDLLSYPLGHTGGYHGSEYEYLTSIFVDYLVNKLDIDFLELIQFVVAGEPKQQLGILASQRGYNLGMWYHQFARDFALTPAYADHIFPGCFWCLTHPIESRREKYHFQIAEANDTIHLPDGALVEIAVDGDPAVVDVVVLSEDATYAEEGFTPMLWGRSPVEWELAESDINKLEPGSIVYILATNDGHFGERQELSAHIRVDGAEGEGETGSETVVSHQFQLPGKYSAKLWAVRISETALHIEPEALEEAIPGEEYSFELRATGIPGNVERVDFEWTFDDGRADSQGSSTGIAVGGGMALVEITRIFEAVSDDDDGYTLTAVVKDSASGEELAHATASIVFPFEVTIVGTRIHTWELQGGADDYFEATQDFEARAEPDGSYIFDWDFDDGNTDSDTPQPGARSQMSHTYTDLQDGDEFRPTVTLRDLDGTPLATDSVVIYVSREEVAGPQDIDCGWEVNFDELTWEPHEPDAFFGPGTGTYFNDSGQFHGPSLNYNVDGQRVAQLCYFEGDMHGYAKSWGFVRDPVYPGIDGKQFGFIQIRQENYYHNRKDGLQLNQYSRWDWDSESSYLICSWSQYQDGVEVDAGEYDGLCQWY